MSNILVNICPGVGWVCHYLNQADVLSIGPSGTNFSEICINCTSLSWKYISNLYKMAAILTSPQCIIIPTKTMANINNTGVRSCSGRHGRSGVDGIPDSKNPSDRHRLEIDPTRMCRIDVESMSIRWSLHSRMAAIRYGDSRFIPVNTIHTDWLISKLCG